MRNENLQQFIPGYNDPGVNDINKANRDALEGREGEIKIETAYIDLNNPGNGCNFKCLGCFKHMDDEQPDERLSFEEIIEIIRFAKTRGAKTITFAGQGEPLLDPDYFNILDYIEQSGLTSITFTNGSLIKSQEIAHRILKAGPVIIKRNSMNGDLQDKMVGLAEIEEDGIKYKPHELMDRGINLLLQVREVLSLKNHNQKTIGVDSYITKENIDDLPDVLRYCRDNNLVPYFESFIEAGQNKKVVNNLAVSSDKLTELFKKLQRIDRDEYNTETDVPAGSRVYGKLPCKKANHAISVRTNGDIYACVSATENPIGNIHQNGDQVFNNLSRTISTNNNSYKTNAHCINCSKKSKQGLSLADLRSE